MYLLSVSYTHLIRILLFRRRVFLFLLWLPFLSCTYFSEYIPQLPMFHIYGFCFFRWKMLKLFCTYRHIPLRFRILHTIFRKRHNRQIYITVSKNFYNSFRQVIILFSKMLINATESIATADSRTIGAKTPAPSS